MAKINCKICEGEFNLPEGITAGECPYCGTTTTFPKIRAEHHEQLYNQAGDFLRYYNSDKADVKEKTTSDSDEIAGCFGVIDQQTAAQRMVIEAEGIARKRQLEGYSYQDERRFDVAEQVASNQATGELANLGIGMGMISGIGGTMGNAVGDMMTGVMTPQTTTPAGRTCPQCSTPLQATAKFCLECGAAVTAAVPQQVICPKCGASVYKSKFCSECGASQVRTCPSCSKEVADNAKFCLECGAKLV